MKVRQFDEVFSVVLSAGLRITSSNLNNKDSARSESFCDFCAFSKRGGERHFIFMKGVPASKKVWKVYALEQGWASNLARGSLSEDRV